MTAWNTLEKTLNWDGEWLWEGKRKSLGTISRELNLKNGKSIESLLERRC